MPAGVLQEGISRLGLGKSQGVGVLASDAYSLLQVEPPSVPSAELREAIRWQIRELIDYPVDEAVVDVFSVPQEGRQGRSPIAYAVAARRGTVQEQAVLLKAARLKISALDIPELALRNLTALLPEDERGLAFLSLGRTQGMLILTRGQNLYLTRRINIGSDQLMELAAAPEGDGLVDLSSRFNDLLDSVVLEVQRSLDFYESNFSLPPISSLVVAPMEAILPQVIPYLKSYLGITVRSLDLSEILECPGMDSIKQARCLQAIGASLRRRAEAP